MTGARPARAWLDEHPVGFGLLLGALCAPVALGISTTPIALAAASDDLGLGQPQAAWILIGYAMTQAMAVPLCGRLGDTCGLRGVMWWIPAVMLVGTLATSMSTTFSIVLAGRVAQGAAGGALTVVAISLVVARVPASRRSYVLGTMTAVIGLVSGAGTWIGGVLTDAVSWRLTFALPALALLAWTACVGLVARPQAGGGTIDLVGATLVTVTAGVAVVLLESPSTHPATPVLLVLVAAETVVVAALVRWIRRRPFGFIPSSLVANRGFVFASTAALMVCSGYVALLFVVPQLLAARHGWSPTQIGTALLPAAAAGAASAHVVGRVVQATDGLRVGAALALCSAAGVLTAAIGDGRTLPSIVGLALVLAAQTGTSVALLSRVTLMVGPATRNLAAGLFTLLFQIGGPIGTAIAAGLAAPLGTAGALAAVAALPGVGVVLVLRSWTWAPAQAVEPAS